MSPEELRGFCLSFNAAVEDFPFNPGISVFKVLGKMFALSWIDARPLKVNLKCDPEDAVRLRGEYEGLITPGYHMNKQHWITLHPGGNLLGQLVDDLVTESYLLVVEGLPQAKRPVDPATFGRGGQ